MTSKIKGSGLTKKLYYGMPTDNANGWYYKDFDIASDVAQYGTPISIEAYGQYRNTATAHIAGTSIRAMTPINGITVYAYVTYSKNGVQII